MVPSWQRWLSVIVAGMVMFFVTYFLRGVNTFFGLSDAALVPGAVLLSIAGLRLIYRTGIYDASGYGMSQLFQSFRKQAHHERYRFDQYQEAKMLKRKQRPFMALPFVVVGGLFILLALIFSQLASMS